MLPAPTQPRSHRPLNGLAGLFLLGTGSLLGVTTIMAKVAFQRGLDGSVFLFASVGVAASILLFESVRLGHRPALGRAYVLYYFGSAALSVVAPNLILFSVIPLIGSGYASLSLALPPLLTYAGAVGLGMEKASILRLTGVVFALTGSLWLAAQKLTGSDDPQLGSLALLALVPVLLAAGNIYRTRFWPPGASPDQLAPGMLIASGALLALPAIGVARSTLHHMTSTIALLIIVQGAVLAVQYLMFFELQRRSGPVMLSLIGSVAAVVAIPLAVVLLDEPWPAGLGLGALMIGVGMGMVVWPQSSSRD